MSADQERQALLGLALASLPDEHEDKFRDAATAGAREELKVRTALFAEKEKEQPPSLGEALHTLAGLARDGRRQSNRLLTLDLLAKLAHRRGIRALDPVVTELYGLLEAEAIEGERRAATRGEVADVGHVGEDEERVEPERPTLGAEPHPDPRVNKTVSALENTGVVGANEHHWTAFAMHAQTALALTDAEVNRPLCTDEQWIDMPNGRKAVRTAVWFWSDAPASTFANWTDPRSWDQSCHLFFKSVQQKTGPPIPTNAQEFSATFTETVNIDGTSTLSTDLVFSRTVHAPDLYALEFNLPDPPPTNPQILVDTGQVTVRHDQHAPPGFKTALLAEKFILFEDPAYDTWPTLACDLFWTEFAITMALGCT